MKILAIDKILLGTTEEKYPHIKKEAAKGWEFNNVGVFCKVYCRKDSGAVLILECTDVGAKEVLDTVPLVKAGLVDFDITPLGPFMPCGTLLAKPG